MIFTSIDFNNSNFKEYYRYEIEKFTILDFLRGWSLNFLCFDSLTISKIYNSLDKELYVLYGVVLEICSDPYDKQIALAISDSLDELHITADLHGLTPLVNKV